MRTDAEKQAFAMKCLEIEKAGGNVQEYIAKNWPSYSPRATWYNLQREYLKRNTAQLTEGKPEPKREEVNEMRRAKVDLLNGVLKVLAEKGDPLEYMKEQGYKFPQQAWADLRNWANAHNMNQGRLPEDLRKYYARIRADKPGNVAPDEKPGEHPTEAEKAPETPEKRESGDDEYLDVQSRVNEVFFGGKAYEKMEKPSPTCCQPAPPSGVTVPDELPEESLQIAAVRSAICDGYKYERVFGIGDQDNVALVWRDPVCRGENSLIFSAKNWLQMAKEIPQMLKQLGLI